MIEDIRVQIITDINQVLISAGKPTLSVPDFDILYEMDVDELTEVLLEITRSLDSQLVHSNHI